MESPYSNPGKSRQFADFPWSCMWLRVHLESVLGSDGGYALT
jgi:hypothetical protein